MWHIKYMVKKIKSKKNILLVSAFIIPILVILWFFLALIFVKQTSFTVLDVAHTPHSDSQHQDTLKKGDIYQLEFKSTEDNLGLIKLKFKEHKKTSFKNEDELLLKIKEIDKKEWYYVGKYRSGIFEDQTFFPFGFPVIKDSKNKTYVIELSSLKGNDKNAVTPDYKAMLISGHVFSKTELLSNKPLLYNFVFKKIYYSFANIDFLLQSLVFALPLIAYFAYLFYKNKIIPTSFFVYAPIFLFFIDIIFFYGAYIGFVLIGVLLWSYAVVLNRFSGIVTFCLAFLLVFLWVCLMLVFGMSSFQKIGTWVYGLFVLGSIQLYIEIKFGLKFRNRYNGYFKKFF